ncbi:hypothetical protein BW723_01910 [Polaribacter reichenbachii]|uniref:Uncharacterized protein n=1 Tax=Polaribacter reichenbachii TaxID=996801 RepID=A0A1B8TVU4_9FLAO|nr:hypothetical protein BW723_01910 [Polaribacter reichenbachii]AUC18987.1 hypothetical protein BTO17_09910 [Polaribacter reichenbachii]OBY63856.1 hypothetical protein LPB301_13790 [Polaribacter reichenbachii]
MFFYLSKLICLQEFIIRCDKLIWVAEFQKMIIVVPVNSFKFSVGFILKSFKLVVYKEVYSLLTNCLSL